MGGPENGNFPLLYVVKMSLRRWVVQKSLKTPLRNMKMAPNVGAQMNVIKSLILNSIVHASVIVLLNTSVH